MSNIQSYSNTNPSGSTSSVTNGGLLGSLFNGSLLGGGSGSGLLGSLFSPITDLTGLAGRQLSGVIGNDYNAGAAFTNLRNSGNLFGGLANTVLDGFGSGNNQNYGLSLDNGFLSGNGMLSGSGVLGTLVTLFNGRGNNTSIAPTTYAPTSTMPSFAPTTTFGWNDMSGWGYSPLALPISNYGVQWAGNPYAINGFSSWSPSPIAMPLPTMMPSWSTTGVWDFGLPTNPVVANTTA
jgi:hypothetical protein